MTSAPDPTRRFSDRVDDYERHRPRYPASVYDALVDRIGIEPSWIVADVGAGTGISAELFLDRGHTVWAVEPNDAMRAAAERRLGGRPAFRSVRGTAERTGLEGASVDLVVAAQAFHWFEPGAARRELGRVLRPPGWVALVWNTRHTKSSDFLRGYEALLLDHGTDYARVRHEWSNRGALDDFFGASWERVVVPNEQILDRAGLKGRTLSSSYLPGPGHPGHTRLLTDLADLFDTYQEGGRVRIEYDCEVFIGRLRRDT
jgi:SAM-dependent methyltransferase